MCILLIMYKGIANYITLANCHWKSLHYFSVNILSKKIVIDKSYVNMHCAQHILYSYRNINYFTRNNTFIKPTMNL